MAGRMGKVMVTLTHLARRRAWVITSFSPPLWTGDEGDPDHIPPTYQKEKDGGQGHLSTFLLEVG